MEKYNVFLGGTCAESTWRDELIPLLDEYNVTYFNPVVDDWTPECQAVENWHKENDDYNLFVITKEMQGVFSIAEVVDLSNKKPNTTIFCVIPDGFDKGQLKSLQATIELVKNNGGIIAHSIKDIADILYNKIHVSIENIFYYENILEIKPDSGSQDIPETFNNVPKIFLAGTIDMGNSVDWQSNLCKILDTHNKKCVVFNPRREHWEDDKEQMNYQINWELNHLESSDIIVMNILGSSKSPISLLELGLFARTKKLIVICEDSFYRFQNIQVTCKKYNVPLYTNLNEYLTANLK